MEKKTNLERRANTLGNMMGIMMFGIFVYLFIVVGALTENKNQTRTDVIIVSFICYAILCFIVADKADQANQANRLRKN